MQSFLNKFQMGKGILVAISLLLLVELAFHQNEILFKYRSVFASGRLMEKIFYINQNNPKLLIVGNSRIDNGIDPVIAANVIGGVSNSFGVFNLGIPGSNTRVIQGVMTYINKNNNEHDSMVTHVLIGLDPGIFTLEEELGYSVFFGSRKEMWARSDYKWLLASTFRLWGFSINLKGLREPDKLIKFIKASVGNIDAWGGDASTNKGFRAEEGVLSLKEQNKVHFDDRIKINSQAVKYFMRSIEDLQSKGIKIAFFFPLVYRKEGVISVSEIFETEQLKNITDFLKHKKVSLINDIPTGDFSADDFFNPGHFNKAGANKFTYKLMTQLQNDLPNFIKTL